MKEKKWKRILAGLLCAVMVLSNAAISARAEKSESSEETAGSFILAASTLNENLIEPVRVEYTGEDTIRTALEKTDYNFERADSTGFIVRIEGHEGNFSIFCSDGGYELDRSPEGIDVVEFTEMTSYAAGRMALIKRIVEYQEMENHVQEYGPARDAWARALDQYRSAEEDTAEELLANLNQAISDYEENLNKDTCTVTVHALQNGEEQTGITLEFRDDYKNVYTAEGTTIELRPESYQYLISDGAGNSCKGQVTITESTTLEAVLPYGDWFGQVKLLSKRTDADGKKLPYPSKYDAESCTAVSLVDDRAGGSKSVYLYAEQGADAPSGAKLSYLTTEENLWDTTGASYSWASERNELAAAAVRTGMEETEGTLCARYTSSDGSTQIQSCTLRILRTPTADIILRDSEGNRVNEGFDATETEYELKTSAAELMVETVCYGTDGYSVQIRNGETESTDGKILLEEGTNIVSVIVSHTNGQSKTYTFQIRRVGAVDVRMDTAADVEVKVYTKGGQEIKPVDGLYRLIPGGTYTYVASRKALYFTEASFTVTDEGDSQMTVTVAEPETTDALTAFGMYNAASAKNRKAFESDREFSAEQHAYQYTVSDANTGIFVQATPLSGYTVKALWTQQSSDESYHGVDAEKTGLAVVNERKMATVLSRVLMAGGYGNTLCVQAYREQDGVTYYQNYQMTIRRALHLKDLALTAITGDISLTDENGNALVFDREVRDYYAIVVTGLKSLTIHSHFTNENSGNNCDGGYYALIRGRQYGYISDLTIPLDEKEPEETLEIQVGHENGTAESSTYRIHVVKKELAKVSFQMEPDDAVVFIKNEVDHSTVYPEDDVYKLMPGVAYTYTVTRSGYKTVQVTGFKVTGDETVRVTLTKAPENTTIKKLPSQWPSFRDQDNNGVISEKTPVKAEDAVLYWANKDCFDGYCGHPILVNGYLYTYDSKNLLKLDTVTGELVKRGGALVRASSFSIQPPTYADGMIFVGLGQGTIQAFNADTMESLWVYQDELKGQPNSQIVYKNGYIYTGFWNSETQDANFVCISVTDEEPSRTDEAKAASWTCTRAGGYYWAGAYVADSGKFLLEGTEDGASGYKTENAQVLSLNPKTGEILDTLTLPYPGDIRSNITHDTATGDYYFTSKGGYFYRVSVEEDGKFDQSSLRWIKLENGSSSTAMSTSTPTVYNGRAYIGVCGSGQFEEYSGHSIAVLDLSSMTVAYYVKTQGYPQTSGLLTKAYAGEDGTVYVYFFDNMTPGKLRVISDKPGQTAPAELTTEETPDGNVDTGYVLFTPSGAQTQYALCSPIVDEYGTLYFRNDSNHMMALGSVITKLEVTKQPDKTVYQVGQSFDKTGMQVMATYQNGTVRDVTKYVTFSEEPLTEEDTDFAISFRHVLYQDRNGETGVDYTAPIAHVSLRIGEEEPEGAFITGSVSAWDAKQNMTFYLYDTSVSEEEIREDLWKISPERGRKCRVSFSETAAAADSARYETAFTVTGVENGEYQMAIAKAGKYVAKIIPVSIKETEESAVVGLQKLWLYGDVTDDGKVTVADAREIQKYIVFADSVFDENDSAERLVAANVTAVRKKDTQINVLDGREIRKYAVSRDSVFDSIP